MRTSLERAASVADRAIRAIWDEVDAYIVAAQEALGEITTARKNGDQRLAQAVRRALDEERQKIRDHRGATDPLEETNTDEEAT